jgi:hypothetical protein
MRLVCEQLLHIERARAAKAVGRQNCLRFRQTRFLRSGAPYGHTFLTQLRLSERHTGTCLQRKSTKLQAVAQLV